MPPSSYSMRHLHDVCGGDHICFLCTSHEERWRVLGEFYAKGLANNEKMMFFNHNMEIDFIMNGLSAKIPSIGDIVKTGQFQILHYSEIYLTDGIFDAEALIVRLNNEANQSLAEGYTALRACGDMSWVHSEDNLTKKLIHYDSSLNYDWPIHYSAICMYDVSAFQPDDMLQILSIHPQAVITEKLVHNIYYMPPDEYLGPNLAKSMLDRWMHNIMERMNVEEQLLASKMEAEKAVTAKTTFLATMSHEIRNPTNGIIGSVDMLAQTNVTKDQKELVDIIQSSCKHLYRVVNDVLDFSKLENGKLNLLHEQINLSTLVEDSIRLCQYSIQKNLNVALRQYVHESCPAFIIGDETKLRQILVNLIGNACKFTESGEVVVSVMPVRETTTNLRESNSINEIEYNKSKRVMMEFSVSDSGSGIAPTDQGLLFKTFTKLDASRKWAGTGLGLAICKQLVESMGGNIYLKSVLGEGSTFYFQIPLSLPRRGSTSLRASLSNCKPQLCDSSSSVESLPVSPPLSPTISPSLSSLLFPEKGESLILDGEVATIERTTNDQVTNDQATNDQTTNDDLPKAPIPLSPSNSRRRSSNLSDSSSISLSPPLSLSLVYISDDSQDSSPEMPSPDVQESYDFSKQKILVIEDDVINQKVLGNMLRKLMCQVTFANNGLEGLKLTADNEYTLIITDQYMPTMDGVTAVQKMREMMILQGRSLCPVVVCTGTDEPRLHEIMDDVLVKPVKFKTIVSMMNRICTT